MFVQGLGLKVRCRSVVGGCRLQLDCGERVGAPFIRVEERRGERERSVRGAARGAETSHVKAADN